MRASLCHVGRAQARTCIVRQRSSIRQTKINYLACRPAPSRLVVFSTPQPDVEEAPANAPQEWDTPMPSKRPDIFPEFEKLETVLPKPLPGDPEVPDEEFEEEKIKAPPPGDPEPVDPDNPDEPEDPEKEDDNSVPERPQPGLPKIPQ